MKTRICLIPLVLLLTSCSNRPTEVEHNAAIQILDREKEKLGEKTVIYNEAKDACYWLMQDKFIRQTKEYVCTESTVRLAKEFAAEMADLMKMSRDVEQIEKLRKSAKDKLNETYAGYNLWLDRAAEFDLMAKDKNSTTHRDEWHCRVGNVFVGSRLLVSQLGSQDGAWFLH